MFVRKKVSDENFVIARPNEWLLIRYLILFLFNKFLSSYLLRIDTLDDKYSDLSNHYMEGYEINGPRPFSTRFCTLQMEILIPEPQFRLYCLDCVLQGCLWVYNSLEDGMYVLITLSGGTVQIAIISGVAGYYI